MSKGIRCECQHLSRKRVQCRNRGSRGQKKKVGGGGEFQEGISGQQSPMQDKSIKPKTEICDVTIQNSTLS